MNIKESPKSILSIMNESKLEIARDLLRRFLASHNDDRFCECFECRETRLFLSEEKE